MIIGNKKAKEHDMRYIRRVEQFTEDIMRNYSSFKQRTMIDIWYGRDFCIQSVKESEEKESE